MPWSPKKSCSRSWFRRWWASPRAPRDPNGAYAAVIPLFIKAAIEIQFFLQTLKKEKQAKKEPFFEARIGIHVGPIIAGVVGLKKFAYDIWGDTVNVASRMESSGEPGKVNISEDTYNLVKEDFSFEYR